MELKFSVLFVQCDLPQRTWLSATASSSSSGTYRPCDRKEDEVRLRWCPADGQIRPVVTICTTTFNIKKFDILPMQCIFVFSMDLRTNSGYYMYHQV